ncbi:helix-turn-helix domain-containing protein [Flavobacterium sp. Sd200]|uniref:helix-turn-helix domain-containing protein n=1 Tax=Flavobacterium sp. Sd200 TaxID=2692211 RepID=UPI0013720064|nr:AraC family transcriptional regulator [Flavobacterium sp. Sd200]MXN90370.1 helix-turn-helix domain-containing protein [Flavobacterium sp. Sd200]
MDSKLNFNRPHVFYSCYIKLSREGEQFIPEHVFTYIESGKLLVNDGRAETVLQQGDFAFYVKNHLAKFTKIPSLESGEFKAVSVLLDTDTLKQFARNFGYTAKQAKHNGGVVTLESNPLYISYTKSLLAYLEKPEEHSDALLRLKVNEAILLLLETKPEMTDILFDFNEPGKIDLKAFMTRNFHFNVDLSRFAYLTGRSLSTFKRDFQKIFSTTPNKWLQQKRLDEAYFLISQKGRKPSDVYLEVGFENLSHFSFAFKKAFGITPSQLQP